MLWFLSTLIIAKIFMGFIVNKVNHLVKLLLIVTLAIVIRINFAVQLIDSTMIRYIVLVPLRAIYATEYIVLGYIIKHVLNKFIIYKNKLLLLGISVFLLGINVISVDYMGNIDMHFMLLGNMPLAVLLSITGSFGVIIIGCKVFAETWKLSKLFVFLGQNSLFIMVIHNYLMLQNIIAKGINFVWNEVTEGTDARVVIEITALLIVVLVLSKFVAPVVEKVLKGIEEKLNLVCLKQ